MSPVGLSAHSLHEIVDEFGGELIGDGSISIDQVASLAKAQSNHISFVAEVKFLPQLNGTTAGAVIVHPSLRDATSLPRIISNNPYAYFARVSAWFNPPEVCAPGVHHSAVVDATANVARSASIGPLAVVGRNVFVGEGTIVGPSCVLGANVSLGEGSRLYPNVVIYHNCQIGNRVILHSGVVIGSDGFGLAQENGKWLKIPQIGRVVIGDDVEIGANTTVDRGAIDDTIIEEGVKLDNHIQIAHNVQIGAHTAIAGCVGIAGSTKIGRYCMIGGQAGIAGHIEIADRVVISAKTAVTKSIPQPGLYTSTIPFMPHKVWLKNAVHLRHLDDLVEKVQLIERKLRELGKGHAS
jgi:UDP-3-O-[3-hydroxymyristoyl] glucosamine N-acyltransferase